MSENMDEPNFITPPVPMKPPQPSKVPPAPIAPPPTAPPDPIAPPTTPATPLSPPGPTTSLLTPTSGPNRFKRFFQGSKFKYFLAIPVVLIVAVLIFGYVVLAKGQTKLGENLQDKIWQTIIDNSNKDAKEIELSVTYTDTGTYKFVPSNFVKPFYQAYAGQDEYLEKEMADADERYSFTIANLTTTGSLQTYFDFKDKEKPKIDAHVVGKLSNNQKEFEVSGDLKLKDDEAYGKYDYNNNVEDLISYLLGGLGEPRNSRKNQWRQTKNEYELKSMREALLIAAQLKDPGGNSNDAKRVSDIRQIGSALELYYDSENGQYPEEENGKPKGIVGTYLGQYPTAPTPPDGNCSDDMNNYKYEAIKNSSGQINSYLLTFCLGSDMSGLKAGNYKMSPSGMESYACPSTRTCSNPSPNKIEEQTYYQKLLRDNRLFDIQSFKGITFMDGKPVMHYSLALNKDKLKTIVSSVVNKTFNSEYNADIRNVVNEISAELIAKINVDNYEVWVGITDHKLYKSSMTINALSVTKAADYFEKSLNDPENPITKSLTESTDSARRKSRDAKRLADARQIGSALELYYNDHNEYPEAQDGQPLDLDAYIGDFPSMPMPPDGQCTEYDNTYWYTKVSPSSYKFNLCLGAATGGMPAGVNTLTEHGFEGANIQSGAPSSCPDGYSCTDYQNQEKAIFESFKSTVINTIRNLDFDAKIQVEYNAKNIGKTKDIEAPKDFIKEPDYNNQIIID